MDDCAVLVLVANTELFAMSHPFLSPHKHNTNFHSIRRPADIWAVGITLYLMIYGKLPFMASSLMEIYRRIVEEEVTFSLEPQAPTDEEALQSLIKHMLDKDPQKRATLRDIMEHPWVTLNGTVPLEPTEYKVRLLNPVL